MGVFIIPFFCSAISQAGKRDELLSRIPSKEGDKQVQWVGAGMEIELEQYVMLCFKWFNSSFCFQTHIEI